MAVPQFAKHTMISRVMYLVKKPLLGLVVMTQPISPMQIMDACKAEPVGDFTIAKGAEQTVEMVHYVDKQSAVLDYVETQTKRTSVCGSTLNESPQAAGLEEDCSVLKHGDPTSSELLTVAPNPIGETSVIQVEPEARNSDGYCTTEAGSALSETVMGLEPNKETAVPMQENIGEANDNFNNCEAHNNSEIHAFEVSMETQSSEVKEVSSIQSGAANLSTQTTALPDVTGQTSMASTGELVSTNEHIHMQGTEINSEQQTKMVSPAESAPANDEHVQDIVILSSEQQTKMVLAAEIDALCVQETAIIDLGGARGTVDLNDIRTQVPALPGRDVLDVEAHILEQKKTSSPGDEIKGSEQAKIESIAEIETVGVKENVIADHKETGNNSGVSIHAPLLVESGQKASPGVELRGIEVDAHVLEQAKMVSALEPDSTPEVCADKLEPSGADDVGMIVVQEAASVDDHNRAQGGEAHCSEQIKMASIAQAVSSMALVGYSSSEDSMVDAAARVTDADFVDSKAAGVYRQETMPTQTTSTLPENMDSPATAATMVESKFAASSEHVAGPEPIDETSVMQVELATSTGDGCAADGHNLVSSETVVEVKLAQEIVVPSPGGSIEANNTSTISEVYKDTQSRASGEACNDGQSHGDENMKLGEAYTELQLAPSSGEEAMTCMCSELPSQEVEAPSSDPLENNEETKNEAAAQGSVNEDSAPRAENAKIDEADTEQELLPSGEATVDESSELLSQDEKVARKDAKMEESAAAAAAQRQLTTEVAHASENAKLGEDGTELQLPPPSMVDISREQLSQEVEVASSGPSGTDETAEMKRLNTEHSPGDETSKLVGTDLGLQLSPSGDAMVDISNKPPSCQDVKEAPSSDILGNDENSDTEKTPAALHGRLNTELAPSGRNTEFSEADTGKQETPVSAEAMVESSSEPRSHEAKEAPTPDLSGDDEKAKSARAAVVAELFGDATEGGSDQPLPSPREQGKEAEADGGF
ncbi:Chromatin structure-remodeling complex protein SYD [Zea mays]|uniref:Chromatin structure-remodeling complex protein SYD n=1 Tax=Zea mays TaxID=4577 RepID=A0A1D6LWW1_MAIZE|nr:Chromatin structure-remodeling complex protein SYD [Zea mays]